MGDRIKKECPRCKGDRGFWRDASKHCTGTWHPCITCKTQGVIKFGSIAEFHRLERSVANPEKVKTKQREKEKSNAK
jgi:hypothetical protein